MARLTYLPLLCVCLLILQVTGSNDTFFEELLIRPLKDGKLMTHFQFTTRWAVDEHETDEFAHYNLFPKSMGQIIKKFQVEELHLSFTQGRWWSERWGIYPPLPAPVGVEMWTWFTDDTNNITHNRVPELWKGLTYALSGVFCASMQQMDATMTVSPRYSFNNMNKFPDRNLLRYSILPREAVCTENLTPWIKLLPCRSKAGLASLLNSLVLYDVHYHSMGTHLSTKTQGNQRYIELAQTLTIVFDSNLKNSKEWSLQTLFKRNLKSACPVSSASYIYVQTNNTFDFELNVDPKPTSTIGDLSVYDLLKIREPLPLTSAVKYSNQVSNLTPPQITTQRYFTGYGQEFGGIAVHIFNKGQTALTINYFELVPWYLRLYFHTLQLFINGTQYDPLKKFDRYNFIPAEDRSVPSVIEFVMKIEPLTSVFFTIQFEKAFLHWTEHPPDANRGFDIGSGVITTISPVSYCGLHWSPVLYNQSTEPSVMKVYTDGLLVTLPTPDFSMPYNVITLTGTVFALFFGMIYNLMLRRMKSLQRVNNDFVSNRPIYRLYRSVMKFVDGES